METNDQSKPEVRNDEQGKNKQEKDLKRSFLFGDNQKAANTPGMEGQGMGGHKFGEENHPPTGNDANNPSQNAGSTNAYLAQTRPLEEHTENNNFKVQEQQGEPDYDGAQRYAKGQSSGVDKDDDDDKGPSEYME